MNLLTNRTFLIATLLFLLVAIGGIWLFYPPALRKFNEIKTQQQQLTDELAATQATVDSLAVFSAKEADLNKYYDLASNALPTAPGSDILMLQLEGLTQSLGVSATITLPFSGTAVAAQPAPASSSEEDVSPGGASNSGQPVVAASSSQSQFTIAGKFDFNTTRALIRKLSTFIRWNTITAVSITSSNDGFSASISGQTYWLPGQAADSTFGSDVLTRAAALFSGFDSYTSTPDVTTEGNFGRNDPFVH